MNIEVTKRTVFGLAFSLHPSPLPLTPSITDTVRTLPKKINEDISYQTTKNTFRNLTYLVRHSGKWYRFKPNTGDRLLDEMLVQNGIGGMCDLLYDVEHILRRLH